jgi:cardiolipin hydrolase
VKGREGAPSGFAEAYFSPGNGCLDAVRGFLQDADRTLDLCVFTITDDRISREIEAAHRRGVRLRILSDDDKAHDLGSDIERFERAGMTVRVDRSPHHMHHKFAIADGRRLLNGSYNWTRSAAQNNEENLIVTDEPRLVAAFAREFEALWARLGPGG